MKLLGLICDETCDRIFLFLNSLWPVCDEPCDNVIVRFFEVQNLCVRRRSEENISTCFGIIPTTLLLGIF
jgi:hypothetical protein